MSPQQKVKPTSPKRPSRGGDCCWGGWGGGGGGGGGGVAVGGGCFLVFGGGFFLGNVFLLPTGFKGRRALVQLWGGQKQNEGGNRKLIMWEKGRGKRRTTALIIEGRCL